MSDNQRTRPSEAEVIAKVTEAFVVELRAEWADAGCKTPMQVDGGCDCPDCVLANTVCAALDLVIQHRATPPLAPEVTAEKVALIEALRDAMKVGVPEGSNATEAIRWLTAALSTPPLPSAPERDCTCLGSCKGAQGLAAGWRCALSKGAPPLPSAEPVARVCTHGRENSLFCLLCDDITREKDLLTALDFARTTGDKVALLLAYRTTPPAAAQDTGPKDEAVRWLAILLAGEYDTEWQDAEGVPLPDLSQPCRHLLDAARAAGGE
jgi:hypothetical protein